MKSFRKSDNESLIRLTVLAKVKDEKKVTKIFEKFNHKVLVAEHQGLINANKETRHSINYGSK